jgi:fumarate reductase subunit D
MTTMHAAAHRSHALWLAFLVHRLSGLALAIFLPFHFLVLGLALNNEAQLDGFLRWTEQPLVKLSEAVLVGLLAIHMLGGLRLLALENLGWFGGQRRWAWLALIVAALVAFAFLFNVFK